MNEMNIQIDKTLLTAQDFETTLNLISGKIDMIQEIVHKGKRINNLELDQLLQDSIWTWIFGKDIVNIRKHQRNIKTLTEFNDFIRELSKQLAHIITDLKRYKSIGIDLKEAAADLKVSQYKAPERQLAIIKASINRLVQAKQVFEKKLKEENREKYIT
jgi:hypothetical protein